MSSRTDRALVCAYAVIATLPLVGLVAHLPDLKLGGAVEPAKRPAPTWHAITSEAFQHGFTAWFEARLGFRGVSIRVDNSTLYHGFGETRPGAQVAAGDDDVLFHADDLAYYNVAPAGLPDPAWFERLAVQLARLQARLATEGRALVPVIIPSKTTIFPDAIPERWRHPFGARRPSDGGIYDALRRALDAHGVAYVDGRAMLTVAGVDRTAVWGRQARHWSSYAACQVIEATLVHYSRLSGVPLPDYTCGVERRTGAPIGHVDYDLVRLSNMWRPPRDATVVRAIHAPVAPGAAHPSVLVVGSSFGWTLVEDTYLSGWFGRIDFDYYNATLYRVPNRDGTVSARDGVPLEPDAPGWRDAVLGKDLYIVDLFETYVMNATYTVDFMTQLEAHLDVLPDRRLNIPGVQPNQRE